MLRLITVLFSLMIACAANAQVVLSVDNLNDTKNALELSLDDLDALDQVEIETSNEFVDGLNTFKGPLARDLLGKVGASVEDDLLFVAINEYQVEIPASDMYMYDVILATRMNDEVLPRRTKLRGACDQTCRNARPEKTKSEERQTCQNNTACIFKRYIAV